MANDTYAAYKELVREEQFGPQGTTTEAKSLSWRERTTSRSLRRGLIIIIACFLAYFLYLNRLYVKSLAPSSSKPSSEHATNSVGTNKVPLEAHVMSKCPDAQECLQQLVVPAMEKISDKVDFQLSFIGNVSKQTSDVECKHGPTECVGNMIILCAANLPFPPSTTITNPLTPTIRSLGFANCLISEYDKIPDRSLVEDCALEHGIDFDALNKCLSLQNDELDDPSDPTPEDPSGIALLRKSVQHSEDVGVKTSCTVRLDESVWCVRDGHIWKDCAHGSSVSTLVTEVERLWKQRN